MLDSGLPLILSLTLLALYVMYELSRRIPLTPLLVGEWMKQGWRGEEKLYLEYCPTHGHFVAPQRDTRMTVADMTQYDGEVICPQCATLSKIVVSKQREVK